MKPKRIQRKRTKGWRMPPNTVYVGRPSTWSNPFFVYPDKYKDHKHDLNPYCVRTRQEAIEFFKSQYISRINLADIKKELKGKNLACWCPLDQPCHADVLLEIANK